MKKLLKLYFSLVITLVMLLASSGLPNKILNAKASEGDIASGNIAGSSLSWQISSDYTLKIIGEGDMPDFQSEKNQPWGTYRDQISKIVIEEGVTGIGSHAFNGIKNAEEITIASTVNKVGSYAFIRCVGLNEIILPEGITEIKQGTFYECRALSTLSFPETVKRIDINVVYNCTGLKEITLPKSLEWMHSFALEKVGEGLEKVYCPCGYKLDDNSYFTSTNPIKLLSETDAEVIYIESQTHTFLEWVNTIEPTILTFGEKERTCLCGGKTETQKTIKLAKDIEKKPIVKRPLLVFSISISVTLIVATSAFILVWTKVKKKSLKELKEFFFGERNEEPKEQEQLKEPEIIDISKLTGKRNRRRKSRAKKRLRELQNKQSETNKKDS